ncbi:Uncharacterised protein [Bordetella pertussis]|nr:Uncharacterised protein [Bordetella pertussis]CFU00292.1 Uncharacterised protein [Bordetella pertussis]CFW40595.1 Uncharacterised protein [Bordetella pertussis]
MQGVASNWGAPSSLPRSLYVQRCNGQTILPPVSFRLPRVLALPLTLPASPPSIRAWRWRQTLETSSTPCWLRTSARPPSSWTRVRQSPSSGTSF